MWPWSPAHVRDRSSPGVLGARGQCDGLAPIPTAELDWSQHFRVSLQAGNWAGRYLEAWVGGHRPPAGFRRPDLRGSCGKCQFASETHTVCNLPVATNTRVLGQLRRVKSMRGPGF